MSTIDAFLEALTLEPIGEDRYRATNLPSAHGVVFGGQLLAQSIMAGLAGQEGKAVKTLHTVFARGGFARRAARGRRRAHARRPFRRQQHRHDQPGRPDLHTLARLLSAVEDDVIRHADEPPLGLEPRRRRRPHPRRGGVGDRHRRRCRPQRPRAVGPPDLDVWVRFAGAPDDPASDQALVAYSTDGFLIGTAMRPHAGVGQAQAHLTLSTGVLSHTLTFHEPCPAADGTSWSSGLVRRARAQLRPRRHLPGRRPTGRLVRPGRDDPRPVRGAGSSKRRTSTQRASRPSCRPASRPCSGSPAARPGRRATDLYTWGKPAMTCSSHGTPA